MFPCRVPMLTHPCMTGQVDGQHRQQTPARGRHPQVAWLHHSLSMFGDTISYAPQYLLTHTETAFERVHTCHDRSSICSQPIQICGGNTFFKKDTFDGCHNGFCFGIRDANHVKKLTENLPFYIFVSDEDRKS